MVDNYLPLVEQAVNLVRKRHLRELGNSELANYLSPILKTLLPRETQESSSILVGDAMLVIFRNAIEQLAPTIQKIDSPESRTYTYLKEFILNGKEREIIAKDMGVSRSRMYEIRTQALEHLTAILWHIKDEAEMKIKIKNNLGHPPYQEYIERFTENDENIVDDLIIKELRDGKAYIVALTGLPGVGKSSIAYATASRIVNDKNSEYLLPFEAVIWIRVRDDLIKYGSEKVKIKSTIYSMTDILIEIGSTLERRAVLNLSPEEIQREVLRALHEYYSLIIIDNLDSPWILEGGLRDDIYQFIESFPRPSKVLVTMRIGQEWPTQKTIKISSMNSKEAFDFLEQQAFERDIPPLTNDEFVKIYNSTEGRPLAMRIAMALIRVFGYTIDEVVKFQNSADDLLKFMYQKSYDQLSCPSKKILHALPFFARAATMEALEYVSGVTGPEKVRARAQLFRGNLIERTYNDRSPEPAYTLLPSVNQFLATFQENEITQDRIVLNKYLDDAAKRMGAYYLSLLVGYKDDIDDTLWLLKYEKENILKAIKGTWEKNDGTFVELFDLVAIPLGILRHLNRRITWAERVVDYLDEQGEYEKANWYKIRDLTWSLIKKGTLESRIKGAKILEDAYQEAKDNKWELNLALAIRNKARLKFDENQFEEALKLFHDCLPVFKKFDDGFWVYVTERAKAETLMELGNFEDALSIFKDLLPNFNQIGDINAQMEIKSLIALTYTHQGDSSSALHQISEALEKAQGIKPPALSYAYVLWQSSRIKELNGDIEGAKKGAIQAREIYIALGAEFYATLLNKRIKRLDSLLT